MAGPQLGLNYRIGGPLHYAVHQLAAARAILDAVVCLLIPIRRVGPAQGYLERTDIKKASKTQ